MDGSTGHGGVMAPTGERTSRTAVLSLALGLLAVAAPLLAAIGSLYVTAVPPWFGAVSFPAAVAAIALGLAARRDLRRHPEIGGTGLSLAGTILGVVALAMLALQMLLPMVFVLGFAAFG